MAAEGETLGEPTVFLIQQQRVQEWEGCYRAVIVE
jgi:hypothetical protein